MDPLLLKAINFAAIKHSNQRRKGNNSPYINHPIGVAWSIQNEGGISELDTLVGAILHDTVEDTNTTFEELEKEFGVKIRNLVEEVTDNKKLKKDERKRQQIIHASHSSKQAKLIKLADKLYNLRDLLKIPPKGWSLQRIQGYFVWSYKVIEGIRGTNIGLEKALDEVMKQSFYIEEKIYPALPEGNLDFMLEDYYNSLDD